MGSQHCPLPKVSVVDYKRSFTMINFVLRHVWGPVWAILDENIPWKYVLMYNNCVLLLYSTCSIYLPPFRTADENAAYVRSVVNETLRCANGKSLFMTFHWNCKWKIIIP